MDNSLNASLIPWDIIPQIKTGIALIAFIAAIVALVIIIRTKNKEKILAKMPKENRLEALIKLADDYDISASKIQDEGKIFQLVKERIHSKMIAQRRWLAFLFGVACLATIIAVVDILSQVQTSKETLQPPPVPKVPYPDGQKPAPPVYGKLEIRTDPNNLIVLINGNRKYNFSGQPISLTPGEYSVELRWRNDDDEEFGFVWKPEDNKPVEIYANKKSIVSPPIKKKWEPVKLSKLNIYPQENAGNYFLKSVSGKATYPLGKISPDKPKVVYVFPGTYELTKEVDGKTMSSKQYIFSNGKEYVAHD